MTVTMSSKCVDCPGFVCVGSHCPDWFGGSPGMLLNKNTKSNSTRNLNEQKCIRWSMAPFFDNKWQQLSEKNEKWQHIQDCKLHSFQPVKLEEERNPNLVHPRRAWTCSTAFLDSSLMANPLSVPKTRIANRCFFKWRLASRNFTASSANKKTKGERSRNEITNHCDLKS